MPPQPASRRPVAFLLGALVASAAACSGSRSAGPAVAGDKARAEEQRCPEDHFREYFCDELLPLASSLPAPHPYETCPGSVTHHEGVGPDRPAAAVFDAPYTAHTRKRMPPGHACCYSWCSPLRLASPGDVPADRGCKVTPKVSEHWCFDALEQGTSQPYDREGFAACPSALSPPPGAAFSAPPAAGFDPQLTSARRAAGFPQCCYSWCSQGAAQPVEPS